MTPTAYPGTSRIPQSHYALLSSTYGGGAVGTR